LAANHELLVYCANEEDKEEDEDEEEEEEKEKDNRQSAPATTVSPVRMLAESHTSLPWYKHRRCISHLRRQNIVEIKIVLIGDSKGLSYQSLWGAFVAP
jgi:CO dehydrogenase/acetyl-CoA synthase beta subunit